MNCSFSQRLAIACLCLGSCLTIIASAAAQSYSIDWHKISGGGGTSTNGSFAVTGTIGQADAGTKMSGGNFSVDGGFWAYIAVVQTPGAPLLKVEVTSTNTVVVSWPSPSTGFSLEQNTDASTTNWAASGLTIHDDGTTRSVVLSNPSGNLYFRLKSP